MIEIFPSLKQENKGPAKLQAGGGIKINPANWPVPDGFVTLIEPVDPKVDTTAVMVVEFTTRKDEAGVKPNETAVAVEKFVPVIVTVSPALAVVGEKLVTVGACAKVP